MIDGHIISKVIATITLIIISLLPTSSKISPEALLEEEVL